MARLNRRSFVGGTGLLAASTLTGLARAAQGEAGELKPMRLAPPIGRPERMQRKVWDQMARAGHRDESGQARRARGKRR